MLNRVRTRAPTPVGRFIEEDVLEAYRLTQTDLAELLMVSRRTVNQLVQGHRGLTASIALRLGKLTGTTPEYWLNLQRAVDMWEAGKAEREVLGRISPLTAPPTGE